LFVLREIEHDTSVADYRLRQTPMMLALHTWDPSADKIMPLSTGGVWEVDVGTRGDVVNLAAGFHGRETLASGQTVRWTMGSGVVLVCGAWDTGARVSVDYVDQYCPGGSAPGGVVLAWDDTLLQVEESSSGSRGEKRVTASLPAVTGGVHRLRIGAAAWSPQESSGSPDSRLLGVMVDRVRVTPPPGQSD
jgi:hypothetical protein